MISGENLHDGLSWLSMAFVQIVREKPGEDGQTLHVKISFGTPFKEEKTQGRELLINIVERQEDWDMGESCELHAELVSPIYSGLFPSQVRTGFLQCREPAAEFPCNCPLRIVLEASHKRRSLLEIFVRNPFLSLRFAGRVLEKIPA